MYKALTGAAARVLTLVAERFELIPDEQKALRRRRRGCLDAIAIDWAVSKERKVWLKQQMAGASLTERKRGIVQCGNSLIGRFPDWMVSQHTGTRPSRA